MRKKRSLTKRSNEPGGLTGEGLTQYPAILGALVEPVLHISSAASLSSLAQRNLLGNVLYGIGRASMPFSLVGDLLATTES